MRFDKFHGFPADNTCQARPSRLIRIPNQFHGVLVGFFLYLNLCLFYRHFGWISVSFNSSGQFKSLADRVVVYVCKVI